MQQLVLVDAPIVVIHRGKIKQSPHLELRQGINPDYLYLYIYNQSSKTWSLERTFGKSAHKLGYQAIDARKAKNNFVYEVEYPEYQAKKYQEYLQYENEKRKREKLKKMQDT